MTDPDTRPITPTRPPLPTRRASVSRFSDLRTERSFVECEKKTAVPDEVLESELFGSCRSNIWSDSPPARRHLSHSSTSESLALDGSVPSSTAGSSIASPNRSSRLRVSQSTLSRNRRPASLDSVVSSGRTDAFQSRSMWKERQEEHEPALLSVAERAILRTMSRKALGSIDSEPDFK
eukprot:TRINITY_DN28502_c0_g1_i1.p2 TRINITY_DN28502_c0_g1~~TRINITY_DN28502_c0_g1_i1.p2  ORF type:complete len:178 (+),score=1.82 TRINITY_DN28502_c0_g1_i1:187-720(+)